ncbi:MAG: hypothetical protein LAO24_07835 [Acidobacteriia bacterium]|nr:hypothetical protein [Terriglobia bacterium]
MSKDSPRPWFRELAEFHCPECGSKVGFRSRRRTLLERFILPIFLLQPVRCGECFRRDYRLVFTPVKDRLSDVSGLIPVAKQPAAATKRNVA